MKTVIVFTAVFCINSVVWAQDVQELKYFKSDNAFYLGSNRLFANEVERTLSSNIPALDAWKKGNSFKIANTAMKVSTGVLIVVGSGVTIYSLVEAVAMISVAASFWWAPVNPDPDNKVDTHFIIGITLLSAGVVTGIMIPITKAKYKSCYSDAAWLYNKGLKSTNTVSLHIGTNGNGIGFSLKF